ncbi:hypothetical protein OAL97_04720 [Paracoccaceae bacterium]|jgi:hypothetical protein|nr:hypothetical protein [Paracoccaceae bacterium]
MKALFDKGVAMTNLERLLTRGEAKYGKGSPQLQWLRDQIRAAERGGSTEQMYVTGMIKRKTQTEDG